MAHKYDLPLAVTMGDPAGIGGDVMLRAWTRRDEGLPPFLALDDPARLKALAWRLGLDVPIREIATASEARDAFHAALPVLPVALATAAVPGQADPANAGAVIGSIEKAVALVRGGEAAAVVTNPINKKILQAQGFAHPGHTEFLAALSGPGHRPVMMLACADLRVVPVTIHLSLRAACEALTTEDIVACGEITAAALRRYFGKPEPRLVVAALNPHAGEGGTMGREEIDIIAPAVTALRDQGIDVTGPLPADTLFHAEARSAYDAALCMYHDQALLPIKTIDFYGGVNVTLGLPFIRTSPDHGTAFDIAGTGRANESSFIAAVRMAARMAARQKNG